PAVIWSALLACLFAVLALNPSAQASPTPPRAQHVVVVGLSGLRWSDVSATATPELWRLAGQGSVANLVDYAVLPLTCPADGWLTLNAGARAQSGHTNAACGAFPAVRPAGAGASVPGLPALETYNHRFHNNPDWGLLSGQTPGCATAAGPGAALALADRAGHVASYLPAPDQVTAAVLARCPLTVVDLGTLGYTERARQLATADAQLATIAAALPADTTLLVTAPGAPSKPPHLQLALADGPGYSSGLLNAVSTRQPGLVVLTDLTPTVLGWLGASVPPQTVGAHVTRGDRGSLAATVQALTGRDTAEQVWRDTHDEFFWAYSLADAAVLAAIGLASWGAAPDQRRRRARRWRVAGVFAAAVPAGTFLANLAPWSTTAHPAAWLYGVSVALALVIAGAALLGCHNRGPLAPLGVICLFTVAVLGVDVMTGSGLQLETPFGLSVLEAGRFYGIGNEALGIYGLSGLFGAAWLALVLLHRRARLAASGGSARLAASGGGQPSRRPAVLAVAAVAVFAVFASGWPGFGGKVGGTIAMVPCFLLLGMVVAGIRLNWRRALLVAVSGLALFAVFALISYLVPATGHSDIGVFAGNTLHGRSGGLLLRKINSNLGSLSVNAFSPLIPIVAIVTGLMLWRPAWFRLSTMPAAFAAEPLLRPVLGVLWLMPVLGWLANDSGVIVAAAVLPFALPLAIAILAAAAYQDRQARYRETTVPVAGSSSVSRK
ncbi:MAG TPA: hypothetical protein VK594_12410, partial [Streptosporangiaceae bacterium]|nr:hypothetical protein [Streptosporangiaceae bacterium]